MGRSRIMIFFCLCSLIACNQDPLVLQPEKAENNHEREKIAVNKEIARREADDIKLITARYGWDLKKTNTGLLYCIEKETKGAKAQKNDVVQLKGSISTASGEVIYNSATDGIKEVVVFQSEDVVGLHELICLMNEGEKANAIIPSFLAYGITGDGNQVGALATLICEIELIKINK